MLGCNCEAGLSNLGRPNCVPIQSVTSKLILVNMKATDGTANFIDLTTTLPTWSTLINERDVSKRWIPTPLFENVELPKADSQFEEANSGRIAYLRQGKRSFSGELWSDDSTPTLLGKLASGQCVDFGVYIVDVNGSLIGSKKGTTLCPIPVDTPSWDPKFMFATDSTVQKIMVGFDFDRLFDESTMYMITSEEADQNFNDLDGLVDVNFNNLVQNSPLAGDVTFDAQLDYGTAVTPLTFQGATATDFNLRLNGVIEAFTIVENQPADGNYTVTITAGITVGGAYELTVSRDGFEGSVKFIGA